MALPSPLRVVTQNLWFDSQERESRMLAHLTQWQNIQPDLIAIQEATLACLRPLLNDPWLQGYWSSTSLESGAEWQGIALFSKVAPSRVEMLPLPGSMGRRLLLAQFPELWVGVIHLESMGSSGEVRRQQLQEIFANLSASPEALLLGDFNFCSSSQENQHLPDSYVDCWANLRPDQPGWTIDPSLNRFCRGTPRRLDRALLRSQQWRPGEIQLLGTCPPEEGLFASDHFGLWLQLAKG